MTLPAFRVLRPAAIEDAVRMLADSGPQGMILAGGTDVVPNLQMRLFSPAVLVDLKSIRELRGITVDKTGELRIGALTTLAEIAESSLIDADYPVLARAVRTIAGPLQRNMGTLGGNLCLETRCRWYNQSEFWREALGHCLKKDGDVCHVAPGGKRCWAVWSGDAAPALLTLEAEIEIAGPKGTRRMPLDKFYRHDGINRIALGASEIVTAVCVPGRAAGCRGDYRKLRVRDSIDYPLAGVAVALQVDERGVCRRARLAVTAVNPAPLLVPQANEWLAGQTYSPNLVEHVAQAVIRTGKPLTTSASTPVYRREMLRVFTRRALEQAWGEHSRQPGDHAAD